MSIQKVKIVNFKCFEGEFTINLNRGINILVGDNESGKSTIIEAVHLALTGIFNGKYLNNEITQYLFNINVIKKYIYEINKYKISELPYLLIELHFNEEFPLFDGNDNIKKENSCGLTYKIEFDEKYKSEYEELVKRGEIKTLPIEYYIVSWTSFARDKITSRGIPIKSALIDSSSHRYYNGSDMYISRIIKDNLNSDDIVEISQAHRKMRDTFMEEESIKKINSKIKGNSTLSKKNIELSVEMLSKNAWETSLMTYLDEIPFHYNGKGEQCIIKTDLALGHYKAKEASVILIEEPENHLSHSSLNMLIKRIEQSNEEKQMIISTHSSFVANKLGIEKLFLLNNRELMSFNELDEKTFDFFKKIAGYDTLRLILCKKAILVEGDSDELIVQKAYMNENFGKLPIDDGVDVISVGISFLRFLEIAVKLNKLVTVITDNDGNIDALKRKYKDYIDENKNEQINILYDEIVDEGKLEISGKYFNYNTLEPKLLKANDNNLNKFNRIFGTKLKTIDDMHKYMKRNKTECALSIFESDEEIIIPDYIMWGVNI